MQSPKRYKIVRDAFYSPENIEYISTQIAKRLSAQLGGVKVYMPVPDDDLRTYMHQCETLNPLLMRYSMNPAQLDAVNEFIIKQEVQQRKAGIRLRNVQREYFFADRPPPNIPYPVSDRAEESRSGDYRKERVNKHPSLEPPEDLYRYWGWSDPYY